MSKKYQYTVAVKTRRGTYDVPCTDKKDLDEYLEALKENGPYFQLDKVTQNY